jgi:hypothetical protein
MPGIDLQSTLVLHCDGIDASTAFPDSSLVPKIVTAVSPAQVDTAQFKFGNAAYLGDGASTGLTIPDNADFEFGSGDFTLDCWVRFNALPVTQAMFITKYETAGAQRCFFWAYNDSTASMEFRYSPDGSGSTLFSQPMSPTTATWYHLAVVRDGGDILMFVDGTQIGTTDTITESLFNGTAALNIGAFNAGTGGFLDGWMDEIRVSNVARWTSNFTPPAAPYSVDTYAVAWIRA